MTPQEAAQKLKDMGYTDAAIAGSIDVNQATVTRIRNGTSKGNWFTGNKLIAMATAAALIKNKDIKA